MNKRNLIIAGSILAVAVTGYFIWKNFFKQDNSIANITNDITKNQKEDREISIVRNN